MTDTLSMVEYYTCKYYELLSGVECASLDEIPEPARNAIALMEYEEIIRPFVVEGLRQGLSSRVLSRKYDTSVSRIRQIGRKFGFYKRYSG